VSGQRSRRKGRTGELEACRALAELTGQDWRRSAAQSQRGGRGVPDVLCDTAPELHVEVKRGKAPSLWAAREQARGDAVDAVPVVLARRDRDRWVVLVELDDLYALVDALRRG